MSSEPSSSPPPRSSSTTAAVHAPAPSAVVHAHSALPPVAAVADADDPEATTEPAAPAFAGAFVSGTLQLPAAAAAAPTAVATSLPAACPLPAQLPPLAPTPAPIPDDESLLKCLACKSLLCASGINPETGAPYDHLLPVFHQPCRHMLCDSCSNYVSETGADVCRVGGCKQVVASRTHDHALASFAKLKFDEARREAPASAGAGSDACDASTVRCPDLCSVCVFDDEASAKPAVYMCFGCSQRDLALCEEHFSKHKLHAGIRAVASARSSHPNCSDSSHASMPSTLFCMTEKALVCVKCVQPGGTHVSHDVRHLSNPETVHLLSSRLGTCAEELELAAALNLAFTGTVQSEITELRAAWHKESEALRSDAQHAIDDLRAMLTRLLAEGQQRVASEISALEAAAARFEADRSQLHAASRRCDEARRTAGSVGVANALASAASMSCLPSPELPFTGVPVSVRLSSWYPLTSLLATEVRLLYASASTSSVVNSSGGPCSAHEYDWSSSERNDLYVQLRDARGRPLPDTIAQAELSQVQVTFQQMEGRVISTELMRSRRNPGVVRVSYACAPLLGVAASRATEQPILLLTVRFAGKTLPGMPLAVTSTPKPPEPTVQPVPGIAGKWNEYRLLQVERITCWSCNNVGHYSRSCPWIISKDTHILTSFYNLLLTSQ